MPEKLLFGQIEWTHVWLAFVTALWGGLVSYFHRIQSGMKHSWISITTHMAMSGFAGLMCWLGCLQFDVPAPLTAICTGLAGHMGAEFIRIVELRFADKLTTTHVGAKLDLPAIERRVADSSENPGRRATDGK